MRLTPDGGKDELDGTFTGGKETCTGVTVTWPPGVVVFRMVPFLWSDVSTLPPPRRFCTGLIDLSSVVA